MEVVGNQVVHFPAEGPPRLEGVADALDWLEWPGGLLIFRDTPLERVVLEVERRFGATVVIGDSLLEKRRVTAWFDDEPFEEVISSLCLVVGARCEVDALTARVDG